MSVIGHRKLAVFEMQGAQQIEAWTTTLSPGAATPVHVRDAEEVVVVLPGRR